MRDLRVLHAGERRPPNPVLRGWCAYFRHGVSSRTFGYLRAYAWQRVVRWLRRKHPKAKGSGSKVFVRVRDLAGSFSRWKTARPRR